MKTAFVYYVRYRGIAVASVRKSTPLPALEVLDSFEQAQAVFGLHLTIDGPYPVQKSVKTDDELLGAIDSKTRVFTLIVGVEEMGSLELVGGGDPYALFAVQYPLTWRACQHIGHELVPAETAFVLEDDELEIRVNARWA